MGDVKKASTHLALFGSPFAVGVPVEYNLVRSSVPDLGGGVGEGAVGRPFDLVASRFLNQERLGAVGVSIVIDTFLHVVVEDRAGCDLLFWY